MKFIKEPVLLRYADQVCGKLSDILSPHTEKIQAAGQIRRRLSHVTEVDMLIVPLYVQGKDSCITRDVERKPALVNVTYHAIHDFLSSETSKGFFEILEDEYGDGWNRGHYAARIKGRGWIKVNFYYSSMSDYTLSLLMATGPKDFARQVKTNVSDGGLLPDDYRYESAQVLTNHAIALPHYSDRFTQEADTPVMFFDEGDIFKLLGHQYIPPEQRANWQQIFSAQADAIGRETYAHDWVTGAEES